MILKRESSELRNLCRPSKVPNNEVCVAQSKILTISVHDLALEVIASSALGVSIGSILNFAAQGWPYLLAKKVVPGSKIIQMVLCAMTLLEM